MVVRSLPSLWDKFHVALIASYVAFSGIYWFPGISYDLIGLIKLVVFIFLVAVGFFNFTIHSAIQIKIYTILVLGALGAFVSTAIITGDILRAIGQARNYFEPFLWLVALYGLKPRAYEIFQSRLTITVTLFFLISLYPLAAYIGVVPNMNAPDDWVRALGIHRQDWWAVDSVSVVQGGFAGSRTAWASIMAPMTLFIIALYYRKRCEAIPIRFMTLIILVLSIAGIIITGARGGTIALIMAVMYGNMVKNGRFRLSSVLVVFVLILFVSIVDLKDFLPEFFFRGSEGKGDLFSRINSMTTGRLQSHLLGIKSFMESPLIGLGPDGASIVGRNGVAHAIHNLWLRQMAEGGLITGIPFFLLTAQLIMLAWKGVNLGKLRQINDFKGWPNAHLVILCGLILAMVEPSVIIGSFNANVVIWTAIWFGLVGGRVISTSASAVGPERGLPYDR